MSETPKAIPVERGCGSRIRGGVYAESGLSENGLPLEAFLLDPATLVDVRRLGITPVGTKLITRCGVTHIIDWIGSRDYPNVTDWIEETRRFGLSRRIARTTDFSLLSPESRILLVHSRAFVTNFESFAEHWIYDRTPEAGHPCPRCPKRIVAHDQDAPLPPMCAGVYWQDVEYGEPVEGADLPRRVQRKMPSFTYQAFSRESGITPKYRPAIFASFPITRLVAIHDTVATDKRNQKLLASSTIESAIEDR